MESLNDSLLERDWSSPVSLTSLDSLTPAELAVAALRTDLDIRTRQRAYHLFLTRRDSYRLSVDKQEPEPLFDASLASQPLPNNLDDLLPAGLLLFQFDERCTSAAEVAVAGELFFRLVEDRKKERHDKQGLSVGRCTLKWGMWEKETDSETRLIVEGQGLLLLNGKEQKEEWSLEAQEIAGLTYLAGKDDSRGAMDCTLSISASKLSTSSSRECLDVEILLELGMLSSDDAAFRMLREAVQRWSVEHRFKVDLRRADLPRRVFNQVPRAADRSRAASTLPAPAKTPAKAAYNAPPPPEPEPPPPSTTTTYTERPTLEAETSLGPWRYLSRDPAPVEWQAGFYVRQYAFLESLASYEVFDFPQFSDDEVALLSFAPDYSKLPPLPLPRTPFPSPEKYVPVERRALEYIYQQGPNLHVDETRFVLTSPSFPDLKAYACLASKILLAKDALTEAYDLVLRSRLYPRRKESTTIDPIESLIPLVERLRDDLRCRKDYFSASPTTLIRTSKFTTQAIGVGPTRRFVDKLAGIVAYEERVLRRARAREAGERWKAP
ncbi:hypothetical protein JCM10207_005356 [Rhodosporidiobolus poonsookiae]